MRFYYAITDDLGVLCVDQIDTDGAEVVEGLVAGMATAYPDCIYFGMEVPS